MNVGIVLRNCQSMKTVIEKTFFIYTFTYIYTIIYAYIFLYITYRLSDKYLKFTY